MNSGEDVDFSLRLLKKFASPIRFVESAIVIFSQTSLHR